MLTAKEILEKHYKNHEKRIAYPENVLAAMIEYATLACEEQKILCSKDAQLAVRSNEREKVDREIRNAPLPTLK